jgi:hypothetical protein
MLALDVPTSRHPRTIRKWYRVSIWVHVGPTSANDLESRSFHRANRRCRFARKSSTAIECFASNPKHELALQHRVAQRPCLIGWSVSFTYLMMQEFWGRGWSEKRA